MILIELLLDILAIVMLVPVTVLSTQIILALTVRRTGVVTGGRRPTVAILVPAHNETAVIGGTLAAINSQLLAGDRVLVVADNCTDETAGIAGRSGAMVVERNDVDRRGKGYALDFGMRHLQQSPTEVVIFVDADCQVETGAIDRLARLCVQTARPTQALYLMHSPEGAGLKAHIAEFAWLVKNQVRPLGFLRLGLPCQLMGTGMAFPWELAAKMDLANGNIVEDMKLGIDLALQGRPALFCPDAVVSGVFPLGEGAVKTQRTRWEHGHLSMILLEVPRLVASALVRGDMQAFALALDLAVPPLALLVSLLVLIFTLSAGMAWIGLSVTPLLLSTLALGLLSAAVLLAWRGWGRPVLSLTDLLSVPVYVLSKIPLYLQYLKHRQEEWIRTDRE